MTGGRPPAEGRAVSLCGAYPYAVFAFVTVVAGWVFKALVPAPPSCVLCRIVSGILALPSVSCAGSCPAYSLCRLHGSVGIASRERKGEGSPIETNSGYAV